MCAGGPGGCLLPVCRRATTPILKICQVVVGTLALISKNLQYGRLPLKHESTMSRHPSTLWQSLEAWVARVEAKQYGIGLLLTFRRVVGWKVVRLLTERR